MLTELREENPTAYVEPIPAWTIRNSTEAMMFLNTMIAELREENRILRDLSTTASEEVEMLRAEIVALREAAPHGAAPPAIDAHNIIPARRKSSTLDISTRWTEYTHRCIDTMVELSLSADIVPVIALQRLRCTFRGSIPNHPRGSWSMLMQHIHSGAILKMTYNGTTRCMSLHCTSISGPIQNDADALVDALTAPIFVDAAGNVVDEYF